jgi:hypothetical protein
MIDDDTEAKRPKDKPMSSTRPHSAAPLPPEKTERRAVSRPAKLSDPVSDVPEGLESHGFTSAGRGPRKAMRLSLIVLSCGAVCAFGFGLLLELLG